MTHAPTLDDLDGLGILARRTVPPEFEDLNGHVNVRHHYTLHMEAAESAFIERLGIDEDRAARGEGTFSLNQHITFHAEILVGHDVSTYLRVLDRSEKIIHGMTILADRTIGRVASTIEFVEANVDLTTRRITPMADEVAAALDALLAEHRELGWDLPRSRELGVTRGAPTR